MKIIDLLNIWVEDRNKLPKKIKVDDETYIYDNQLNLYKIPKKDYFLISNYLNCVERLDIEVEVIEENKEIEELNKIKKQLEEQETEDIDTVERELNKMF